MKKYSVVRKYFTIGVMFFFIGTSTVPSMRSEFLSEKNIITVDDEPGDADFSSIKEAVNSSNPGDTNQVYSGPYPEDEILITKENVSLLGISHELGEGNDSGKPFIKGNGNEAVIRIEASHVIVSNFTIENPHTEIPLPFVCGIYVAKDYDPAYDDVTISDCIISNTECGTYVAHVEHIRIIGNQISNCMLGGVATDYGSLQIMGFIVTGNVITDCRDVGIYYSGFGDHINISGNRIRNCKVGIDVSDDNTNIYMNDIENCTPGVECAGSGNIITKNNFKNYKPFGFWFYKYLLWPNKNKWRGNYWDTWKGTGPKAILGFKVFEWSSLNGGFFLILIPWIEFDWHPAKEPYDIP